MSAGFLIARLILGLALAAHGAQKLFGWFGGYGLAGTGGFFAGLGFRPGVLFALAAGLDEVGGGLLTAAGLFGPVGPVLIILVMLVAIRPAHGGVGGHRRGRRAGAPECRAAAARAGARPESQLVEINQGGRHEACRCRRSARSVPGRGRFRPGSTP